MATVRIPTPLRKLTGGAEEVAATGTNIGELITDLEKRYPGIKERICDEHGAVRRFVNIFVKDEDIRFLQNLETPLKDGDEVSIVPAIAGGSEA
jgi:molybdopterin synthase sulfur carrier subunit